MREGLPSASRIRARRALRPALLALALPALGAVSAGVRATAEASAARVPAPASVEAVVPDAAATDAFRLRRAVADYRALDIFGALEHLEAIDLSRVPPFANADRAAFLRARAYAAFQDWDALARLAHDVAGWVPPTPYTAWVHYEALLAVARGDLPIDAIDASAAFEALREFPGSDALVAGAMVGAGRADAALALLESAAGTSRSPQLAAYFASRAAVGLGRDPEPLLMSVIAHDSDDSLDLADAAAIQLAAAAMSRGEDATAWLERIAPSSRYGARARHIRGVAALEAGHTEGGAALLRTLLDDYPAYSGARDAHRALAAPALAAGDYAEAERLYRAADAAWRADRAELAAIVEAPARAISALPEAALSLDGALSLDADALDALSRGAARVALDLEAMAKPPLPDHLPLAAHRPEPPPVSPPTPAEREAMAASRSRLAGARFRLDQTERAIRLERERVERRTRYLNVGLRQAEVEERAAQATHAVLDSVVATLATLEHRLTALRDASIRRLVRRAERLQATSQEHRIRLGRMRHLYAQGPSESRAEPPPPGWPGPDDLLREEVELSDRTAAFSGDFASRVPALIRESCDAYWRPSLIDRAVTLRALAAEHRAGADALAAGLGGAIAELAAGERLDHLEAIAAARAAEVDSLARADDALRAEVAREMARRSIRSLEDERESIDYGLASVSYARAVARDSSGAPDGDAPARRGEAIARLEEFLERYPSTVVRTDVRFRLADLLVLEEQQRFQDAMRQMAAGNAAGHPAGAALAPDYQAALDLYLAILDDDPGFSHRDAALFNVAMILADDADPRAPSYFEALVAQHPESPLCQTAYLRMGDLLFDGKEYARCAAYYESASAGADANLRVIALYKLGWSHLAEQRHADAADAFRRALDLYEGDTAPSGDGIAGVPLRTDLRSECETYLVEAFARSGGAAAFARYFDEIGARRYETRVLQGLSRFFRDFRLYGDAVDADRLFIQRYAEHPDALASAERLIDTYERWDRADAALDARLELAPLFAPDGPWQSAQAADSLRARGSEFARACWETAAVRHHREARAGGPDAETHWRRALALYEEILERWPLGRPAERFRMRAGEAAAQVREHDRALRHFAAAARSDSLELAVDAAWRRVSVRDAWYDSAGSTPAGDSLAANLLREIDDFAARHPGDPRRSELSWRAGNVAFSRGDYRRAADDFDRLLALPVDRERRARAAALRADALYRIDAFGEAGDAYALARLAARTAGLDSLAARIEPSIPICHYRHAESLAARGGPAVQEAAAEFERFAAAWPSHELADEAQYRAALAEIATDSPVAAVASLRLLIERFPESEHVHDAYLRMASLLEAGGRASDAAAAYAAFASRFPKDDLAPTALLDAADMFESEGATARAEELRLGYIERYPDDVETAMTILLPLVRKELDALPGGTALPSLDAPRAGASAASTPRLAAYLARTAARPNLASPSLMAELRYREAEGRRAKYDALRLTQPLDASIKAKVEVLEKVIAGYQKCAGVGVAEWAHASAYRIGQALVAFGEELKRSDRPADLSPDDLAAYEDVLHERAAEFCVRGEDVWSDLLRSGAGDPDAGGWIATTREALWPRLATRFLYRPEMELPLVGTPARASRTADFAERSSIDATTQAEAN